LPWKNHPPCRPRRASDNERPLVEDIRLLGRILGDVIREQEGVDAYELVEQVRKLSVAFRRDADHEADRALKKLLKGLSGDQTVSVIRAFTYFSHLANLAEDRHHIRRRIVHERAGDTQEGSIEVALARLRWAGIAPKTIARRPWPRPMCRRCSPPTRPKCSARASWMPSADIANLLTERDDDQGARAVPKDALAPRELAPTKARCAPVCCSCGRRGCCASPS
jgi:phosphoenolpyruvate carboxylase